MVLGEFRVELQTSVLNKLIIIKGHESCKKCLLVHVPLMQIATFS
eukprot:SAG31_NODE_703_length_12720_cov_10.185088_3_plen_45_part_00